MDMVKWQARDCTTCPEGQGCNENSPWFETTVELRDIIQKYYSGVGAIPKGTHIELKNVEGNGINRFTNPNTKLPFRKGDVVEAGAEFVVTRWGKIKAVEAMIDLQGAIVRYWVPTHRPITTVGEDAEVNFWISQYVEAQELMAKELRRLEFDRTEMTAFADFVNVLKHGVENGKLGPPTDFIKGESLMKAGTGWRFLKYAGACPNPVRYIRAFPEEMPTAQIWHDFLRNGKPSPIGQDIEWYWVTTIVNYVPGLLREFTARTTKWLNENKPDYIRKRGEHHFEDEEWRHTFFDLNTWAELEFRLRQTKEHDKGKKDWNEYNGYSKRIYTPNSLDIKTGVYTHPVEDKPQEQKAAAAQAA